MTSLVTEKVTKMNAWQMPESSKYLREDLVLDNVHLLEQVPKKSGILPRTNAWICACQTTDSDLETKK